ncbi:helix-turn-helix transcriptional regulator [Roseitranquillus sediminis]|uniref:helix-turn-helix transcriptional regulator n=1 Tax=Roseitranquillus sediminis TaxID=2809051 RepID=UPI001D0CAE32|nr:LuxR family transcriptional regulator [Roseitranquillus sediminis]MBM9594686.1 LuxR family transcriptional regulator [Roseitranquillus sediminis]
MRPDLEITLDRLAQATTLEELQSETLRLRDESGIANVVYHWTNLKGEQFGAGTYAPEWAVHYINQNYIRVDPVVSGCFNRFHPVEWKQLDWSGKAARAFLGEAVEAGVGRQGLSVPLRGPNGQFALFTVTDECADSAWRAYADERTRDLILIAHFFNQKALEIRRGTDYAEVMRLSPREIDALTMLAIGYSRAQAAERLSISEHTLRVYIESARSKLGAANTTHAVAKALTLGLILL